jgi:hypothetical protein
MSEASKQALWIAQVRDEPGSMRQRKLEVVERWPGGLDALVREAKAQGVHLLRLTDDHGVQLIAASVHPFSILS